MNTFKNAQRVQESFLSGLEKKTLVRLAQRTPAFINSDHLTALGLVAMFGAGFGYWVAGSHPALGLSLATLCLALNWLGDSLDGTLARVRNKLRPRYGFYVDHVVDMLGALFLLGGLALSGYMSAPVAGGLVIAFLMLSINSYLATYTMGKFQISFGGFSPTELRILLAIGNVFLFWKPHTVLFGQRFLLFDAGGVAGIVGMTVLLIALIARNTAQLYREEPIA
ncbi:MAG TPA: CDP-alcohol phosphatidyltransferase family protein [Bryobacteraceae bacterium]|nr:CDP-alcohol phosphatidyltransferase family protein [Bryobacteraceae bacterium]